MQRRGIDFKRVAFVVPGNASRWVQISKVKAGRRESFAVDGNNDRVAIRSRRARKNSRVVVAPQHESDAFRRPTALIINNGTSHDAGT